jgi:N-acetylglucosamine malate deacetylase 2
METRLPAASSVLAVCAHPDDESFGLGAVLHHFASRGSDVSVLCLTHGEASTLGAVGEELHGVRAGELEHAAAALGLRRVVLLDYPDGGLASLPLDQLADEVRRVVHEVGAELLVVFDDGGVTGHADHQRATDAALAGAPGLPALAWCVTDEVAEGLNTSLGTRFSGRRHDELDFTVAVDRVAQGRAIGCHASQSGDNPVLERRLALQADREALRWLRRPSSRVDASASEEWDARYGAVSRLFHPDPDETLVELVAPLHAGRALDVGAGEGRNALWLAGRGWDVTALDLSGVALGRLGATASAQGLDLACVQTDACDWLTTAPPPGPFDLVVVSFVHPPLDERMALLAAATRRLAPGGHLFVAAHHLDALGVAGPPDPARLYSEDDLRDAAAGLDVLRLFRRTGPNDTGTDASDVVLWARRPS